MTDETEVYTDPEDRIPAHDPEMTLAEKIDELQAEENAVINVYRQQSGNNSKMPFLFTVPIDKYTIPELQQYIRDNYGGGDFRIHIRDGRKVVANKLLSIEAPKDNPDPKAQQGNDLAPVVERMMDRMERIEERLAQPQAQPPQQDPVDLFTKMAGAMAQFQQAMPQPNPQPAGQQKSLVEQLEEARRVNEMFSEMGAGKDDGGFGQLMREGLQPLIQLAQQHAGQKKESGNGASPNPAQPPATTGQPAQPTRSKEEMERQLGPFANSIRTLLFAAQKNGDPETYADMALDFMSEDQYDDVFRFLSSDGCIDAVIEYVPEVANHREWFEALRRSILASLDVGEGSDDTTGHVAGDDSAADAGQPGDPDGAPAGANGHAQDATGDGEDGAGGEDAAAHP